MAPKLNPVAGSNPPALVTEIYKKDRSIIKTRCTNATKAVQAELAKQKPSRTQLRMHRINIQELLKDLEETVKRYLKHLTMTEHKDIMEESTAYLKPVEEKVKQAVAEVNAHLDSRADEAGSVFGVPTGDQAALDKAAAENTLAEKLRQVQLAAKKKDELSMRADSAMVRVQDVRHKLENLLKEKADPDVIKVAAEDLEGANDTVQVLTKELELLVVGEELKKLQIWMADNDKRVKDALYAADDVEEARAGQANLEHDQRRGRRQSRLDLATNAAKTLRDLVNKRSSKGKLRLAVKEAKRHLNHLQEAHRIFTHHLGSHDALQLADNECEAVKAEVDKAVQDAMQMLEDRKDEETVTSGGHSVRELLRTNVAAPNLLQEQQDRMDAQIHADIACRREEDRLEAARLEQIRRDGVIAANIQKQIDAGEARRLVRQRDQQRVNAEEEEALEGLKRMLGSVAGGSQDGNATPLPPLRTQKERSSDPLIPLHALPPPDKTARVKDFIADAALAKDETFIQTLKRTRDLRPDGMMDGYRSAAVQVKLDTFTGDRDKWGKWIALFKGLVHDTNRSVGEKISILHSNLGPQPLSLVDKLVNGERDYIDALVALEEEYGDEYEQQTRRREELRTLKKCVHGDKEGLQTFCFGARGLLLAIARSTEQVDTRDVINDVANRLTDDHRAQWRNHLTTLHGKPTLEDLNKWLGRLAAGYRDVASVLSSKSTKDASSKKTDYRGSSKVDSRVAKNHSAAVDGYLGNNATLKAENCLICNKGPHHEKNCYEFKRADMEQRYIMVKRARLCYVCLLKGHRAKKGCQEEKTVKPCNHCDNRHHTMLHKEDPKVGADGNSAFSGTAKMGGTRVSLGLVNFKVRDKNGGWVMTSAMLDNGSTTSMIKEKFRRRVGANLSKPQDVTIYGVAGAKTIVRSHPVELAICSPIPTVGAPIYNINSWSADTVMPFLDPVDWSQEKLNYTHLADLPLAVPVGEPDMLIGMDNDFLHHVLETRFGKQGEPYAERTVLGWVVRGPVKLAPKTGRMQMCVLHASMSVDERANMFYDGENFGTEHKSKIVLSEDDRKAYTLIEEGISKLENEPGYMVALPWRDDKAELEDNLFQAENRLKSTERRLSRCEKDYVAYSASMEKYVANGYAEKVYAYDPKAPMDEKDGRKEAGQYFLHHHGVWKKNGKEIRVVFDASANVRRDGPSLNDHLYCGPKLQTELPVVLTRGRESDVAYTADIEAMFSRIRLNPKDAKRHRFLWRFPGEEKITVLQMNRVTFGDGPSPCLAIATVQRTAKDYGGNKVDAIEVIQNGLYVDDLFDSVPTVEEANGRAHDVSKILENGDFHLRGWVSNRPDFDKMVEEPEEVKVLGMCWHLPTDTLRHAVPPDEEDEGKLTKRSLLGKVASLFSPLGLASPFVVKAKIRLGYLHLAGLGWDDDLDMGRHADSERLKEEALWWRRWLELVPEVCKVSFPRCMRPKTTTIVATELHTFCDASEEAFAAVCYTRNIHEDGSISCVPLMARTKVASRKAISVAKMELQAALLGARMADTITTNLRFPLSRRLFWTDSSCTRQWVRARSTFFKAFVANRVGEIQELTQPEEWRHVPGKLNVADLATRSALDESEVIPEVWIKGPNFLYCDESTWPKDIVYEDIKEEMRSKYEFKMFHAVAEKKYFDASRFSNFNRFWRMRAWFHRRCRRSKGEQVEDGLAEEDLNAAMINLLREAQEEDFRAELDCLRDGEPILRKSRLLPFAPVLDENGLLRVGGRLEAAPLPYDARHQILLGTKSSFTTLLLQHLHRKHNHPGTNHLLSIVRQKYWVLRGREAIKRIKCFKCHWLTVMPGTQFMADLPKERLTPFPPFHFTSLDNFGPYNVRYGYNGSVKRYGLIMVCMVTRAVHLELSDSKKTEDFLVSFKSFCNLRGQPKYVYSDNGTNFQGAEREIREKLLLEGIVWKFQPPYAPHFGGIHEALVKSAKVAMDKAIDLARKRRMFTDTELRSLLTEVMAFLNSRPLLYQSSDPKDGVALTPNHFLIQRAAKEAAPGVHHAMRLGDHFEFVQAAANDVWKQWMEEYLPTLTARAKWRQRNRNLEVDDVVLVLEDNLPRNRWSHGYITEIYKGKDGFVRAAKVKTMEGSYEKPLAKLCLLEKAPGDIVRVPEGRRENQEE